MALVTGANHGIGAATARALAAQGARVFATYLRLPLEDDERRAIEAGGAGTPGPRLYRARQAMTADEVIHAIRRAGGEAEAWEADLADPTVIRALFDRAEKAFGPVEVLVNNAAHCRRDTFAPTDEGGPGQHPASDLPTERVSFETHDQHFAVNSRAVALMIAEFARRHVARGAQWGRIINVSTDGASGFAGAVSYGASKHALESCSRAAATELGRWGITVNVVSLGPVQTGWISSELEEREATRIPLGRIGTPEDVADVNVFLASEQARWVSGQLLYVGGGHVMPL